MACSAFFLVIAYFFFPYVNLIILLFRHLRHQHELISLLGKQSKRLLKRSPLPLATVSLRLTITPREFLWPVKLNTSNRRGRQRSEPKRDSDVGETYIPDTLSRLLRNLSYLGVVLRSIVYRAREWRKCAE